MASLSRIVTVDPTWTIAHVVRSAMDLLDRSIIQIDVPGGTDALEELTRGGAQLVVAAWELYDDVKAPELALRVKRDFPETAVIVLADIDGPESLDEQTEGEPPFIYMRRPVDIHQFLRVFLAALDGQNVFEAVNAPAAVAETVFDRGPVPMLDINPARAIVKRLLVDVGAMAVVLSSRTGDVLLEDGAPGYLNREQLAKALLPTVSTNIEMSSLVGGQPQTITFYDGDDKDVFVFSVGLHHFLCLVFDGQAGSRQFGVVNRYGRQAVQDLIALLGGSAFVIAQAQELEAPTKPEPRRPTKKKTTEVPAAELEPAAVRIEPKKAPEPEPLRLDPIQNLDMSIFDKLGALDAASADDLFDPDKLAEMVNKGSGRKEVSFDDAIDLGILGDIGAGGGAG